MKYEQHPLYEQAQEYVMELLSENETVQGSVHNITADLIKIPRELVIGCDYEPNTPDHEYSPAHICDETDLYNLYWATHTNVWNGILSNVLAQNFNPAIRTQ